MTNPDDLFEINNALALSQFLYRDMQKRIEELTVAMKTYRRHKYIYAETHELLQKLSTAFSKKPPTFPVADQNKFFRLLGNLQAIESSERETRGMVYCEVEIPHWSDDVTKAKIDAVCDYLREWDIGYVQWNGTLSNRQYVYRFMTNRPLNEDELILLKLTF